VVRLVDDRTVGVRVAGPLVGPRRRVLGHHVRPQTFADLAWIKSQWPGKLVVKGIQTLDDARAVVDVGVDGIVLSNHGGRQLDRAPVPFHLLPSVAREVGKDTEILLDTGIMSGADIVAAIALGARFTLVGRAYLYGLMAGGEAGVNRAIEILSGQLTRTMRLLGVTCLEELSPKHVTQIVAAGAGGAASVTLGNDHEAEAVDR
jgi:L-lactate dehydrogenase (cytochrome)